MSIFPTKILLATDGSKEAGQAAQAAAELSKETGSEVHIAYVVPPELRGRRKYVGDVHLRACVLGELGGGLCGPARLFGTVGGQ